MDILVGFLVSDIVGHDDSMSTLVVRSGDGLEAFLASSVPDLEFDFLVINRDRLDLEINSDSGHEVIREIVISETHQEGGLANT